MTRIWADYADGFDVIPANAGIQTFVALVTLWIPAFAGMTQYTPLILKNPINHGSDNPPRRGKLNQGCFQRIEIRAIVIDLG